MATQESEASNSNNNNNNEEGRETTILKEEKSDKIVHRLKASECSINSVTVFNDRAEISREIISSLYEGGNHEIVVYDLSPDIDPDSIRIMGGVGNATIVEQEVFGAREEMDQTAILLKKIEGVRVEKQKLNAKSENSKKERAWLDGFVQTIRTTTQSNSPLYSGDVKIADFLSNTSSFLSYYAEQTLRIDEQDRLIQETMKDLNNQENVLKKQMVKSQQDRLVDFRREVSIVLNAPAATKVHMQLTYIIMNAHWVASYDARMTSESEELHLSYFGSITNASGEDWNNVKLFLSTAAPSIGGAPPPLRFVRIEVDHGQQRHHQKSYAVNKNVNVQTQQVLDRITKNIEANLYIDDLLEQTEQLKSEAQNVWVATRQKKTHVPNFTPTPVGSMTVMTAVAETSHIGASNATFEIPMKATIVSDNKPHKVTITVLQLKAKLSHYATPDTSGHVYLKATAVNNSEQYPLLTGPMNVFMNTNFVAKSELPDVSPQEKFSVFLGVDAGVRMEVRPVRRVKEKQTGIINKSNIESFRHSAIIKNTRKSKINITVLCQVPVSSDDRIKVKILRPDIKQDHNTVKLVDNKLLKYKFAMPTSSHEELNYHYNVEWPAGLNVVHMSGVINF